MRKHRLIKFFLALIIIGQIYICNQVFGWSSKSKNIYVRKGQKGEVISWGLANGITGEKIKVSWQDESLYKTHTDWYWGVFRKKKDGGDLYYWVSEPIPMGEIFTVRKAGKIGVRYLGSGVAEQRLYFEIESVGLDLRRLLFSIYGLYFIPHFLFIIGLFAYLFNHKDDRKGRGFLKVMIVCEILGLMVSKLVFSMSSETGLIITNTIDMLLMGSR